MLFYKKGLFKDPLNLFCKFNVASHFSLKNGDENFTHDLPQICSLLNDSITQPSHPTAFVSTPFHSPTPPPLLLPLKPPPLSPSPLPISSVIHFNCLVPCWLTVPAAAIGNLSLKPIRRGNLILWSTYLIWKGCCTACPTVWRGEPLTG